MTTPEIILIITTSGSTVVLVINSIFNGWGRTKQLKATEDVRNDIKSTVYDVKKTLIARNDQVDNKLSVIHDLTNGNLSKLQEKFDLAITRIDVLESMLKKQMTQRSTDHPSPSKDKPSNTL